MRLGGAPEPIRPDGYEKLVWAAPPEPVAQLESVIRARLRAKRKSRTAAACRELGWLYSGWQADIAL